MEVMYRRCAGLDIHKKSVVACLVVTGEDGKAEKETRTFGTMTRDLLEMGDWLREAGCTHVAMESTGVYWKPVYNLLEGQVEILLVNAQHIKAVPGRKTDVKDCEWIADLLRHGLLKGSFIPPQPIRELRDLTRHRTKLVQQQASVANRIQKVLEDANIKLASVATDVLGKSGRTMLEAMVRGERDPEVLAEMALRKLRGKIPELRLALEGRITSHHRFLLGELLGQVRFLEGAIERVSCEIERHMRPFREEVKLLTTIPGVNERVAENVIAEIGTEMKQFRTAEHLASWAGMCPGNNESAGKHHSGKTRKGSRWLRGTLQEAAWAASRTKTYLAAQYRRLAPRRGKKRAAVGVGHSILVIAHHLLSHGVTYHDLGRDYFDKLNKDHLTRYLVKRLEGLGHKVTIETVPDAA